MHKLAGGLVVGVRCVRVGRERRSTECRRCLTVVDSGDYGKVVRVDDIAVVVGRHHYTCKRLRPCNACKHGIHQMVFRHVGIHLVQTVFNHNLFLSGCHLLRSECLDEAQIALAVGIGRCDEITLLEGTVHIDLILYHLAHLSVGNSQMNVVCATRCELIVERRLSAHLFELALCAIDVCAHLPLVLQIGSVARVRHLRVDDTIIAKIQVVFGHFATVCVLYSQRGQFSCSLRTVIADTRHHTKRQAQREGYCCKYVFSFHFVRFFIVSPHQFTEGVFCHSMSSLWSLYIGMSTYLVRIDSYMANGPCMALALTKYSP